MQWAPNKIRALALHRNPPSSLCTARFKVGLKDVPVLTTSSKAEPTLKPDFLTHCTAYSSPQKLRSLEGRTKRTQSKQLHGPMASCGSVVQSTQVLFFWMRVPCAWGDSWMWTENKGPKEVKAQSQASFPSCGQKPLQQQHGDLLFWPNQPSDSPQLQRGMAELSPFSLIRCPTYFTGWKCACVCSPPEATKAFLCLFSILLHYHMKPQSLQNPRREICPCISKLVTSYCLWRSNQVFLLICKTLLIYETYRLEKIITDPVTKTHADSL